MDFRKRTYLNGTWSFSTPGREPEPITVPSSVICVGKSTYEKKFRYRLPGGRRLLLTFEGINYHGEVTLNGKKLGVTLPYCHYTFDVTDCVGENNLLTVEADDINAPYGPTDGWNNYGGIIRSVYLDEVPETYISDVVFRYDLSEDLSSAEVSVKADLTGGEGKTCARLSYGGETVAEGGERLTVGSPLLWSPDEPRLYELCVCLEKDGEIVDSVSLNVGFKRFVHDGHNFYLNGKKFFLLGVCRHDLGTLEKGQTLSDADIEKDLVMIKQLGCNFVRLVHYPHDKRVVDMCDRIGLLLSEESGLWWSDLSNPALTDGAVEVLKKTIKRDRNNVSVAFWMGFNECIFTQEFLNDSVAVCRELDPDRYVSGANCMCPEMTVPMFSEAGIDFYTYHPYGSDINSVTSGSLSKKGRSSKIDEIYAAFADKPLLFTEWGGWNVVDNPALFRRFCNKMRYGMMSGKLAGMVYWAFADMYELNRDPDADVDGVQIEGLVTIDRKPKACYNVLKEFYHSINAPRVVKRDMKVIGGAELEGLETLPISVEGASAEDWADYLASGSAMGGRFHHRNKRRTSNGPKLPKPVTNVCSVRFETPDIPAVVTEKTGAVIFGADIATPAVYLLGGVCFSQAWPYTGAFGDEAGELSLEYSDGTSDVVSLRNGIEVLSVCTTFGSSYCDPRSPVLIPAVEFSYDKNFENYRIYVLKIAADAGKLLRNIRISVRNGYNFTVYGLSAETL
ncbi:MAG: hypothetical protein J5830_03465 [Clostridia bacterium]|nr:hypothetical protein [Clostridia bacterium]